MRQRLFRAVSIASCFAIANLSVPYGAVATLGSPLRESILRSLSVKGSSGKAFRSHLLSSKQRKTMFGRAGECPYTAGSSKWDVTVKGVSLTSENYSTSVTDLSFDGGFGIPINVTRSYSANDANEGPFGKGWELSADVRSTAGGLLKSASAPVMSVPTTFKERNTAEKDPNIQTQPPAAVTATDATGKPETVQKDIDGVLTTQPWDNNVCMNVNTWTQWNGAWYELLTQNTVVTPDGTTYVYGVEGSYGTAGTLPWNASQIQPPPTAQPANVLKVQSITDRQGNVTTFAYGTQAVSFKKVDGTTSEYPLASIQMPSGHSITFTWGNGSNAPTNRLVKVSDDGNARTVNYGYTQINGQYLLTSVTTPAGKTTTYGYGNAGANQNWTGDVAQNLLTGITDPRGLTTSMQYCMGQPAVLPYDVNVPEAVCCFYLLEPGGRYTYYNSPGVAPPSGPGPPKYSFQTCVAGAEYPIQSGWIQVSTSQSSPQVTVSAYWGDPQLGPGYPEVMNWDKTYDAFSQELLVDQKLDQPSSEDSFAVQRDMGSLDAWTKQVTTTTTTFNFMGNPLNKNIDELEYDTGGGQIDRNYNLGYAYWDKTKYYQQKATLDQGGRYTYTDYYNNAAAQGSRGQQEFVYDPKNCAFYLNTNITPPAGTPQSEYWRYQLQPVNAADYSANFAYDQEGRCTQVYKLQSTTGGTYSYVETLTAYGSNGSPSWGAASSVTENYGAAGNTPARTTTTKGYTAWGKPDDVVDAAGHEFVTAYDLDGNVQSVTRTDSGSQPIATYTYGTTPGTVSFGQVVGVEDNLTGVTDGITYQPSGGGIGQPSQVAESGGSLPSYSVSYAYDSFGNRQETTYSTPNGTWYWEYHDYTPVGPTESGKMAFQTLTLLDSGSNPTAEEEHYAFDTSGRLMDACFAQTPASGYTPSSGGEWYTYSEEASSRCLANYDYDAGGRMRSVYHYWQNWVGGSNPYSNTPVLANVGTYETTGLDRALKTQSQFLYNLAGSWQTSRTETYSYDSEIDYLTGANYDDGQPNATPSWSYDAAWNRTDSTVDYLNRTTAVPGGATTCDILGNRLTMGSSTSYGWDCLNRMTSFVSGSSSNSYLYRADGMRVSKTVGSSGTTTDYRYDGQMGFEDVDTSGSSSTVTDYGIGARGIDYISANSGSGPSVSFPVDDSHGNMVATLSRYGTGSYSLSNPRSFDCWGTIRQGNTSGDPKGRYCAQLGHKQDDESGIVYMRARYYEPSSGRFLSEDPAKQGVSWFAYCDDSPGESADGSGEGPTPIQQINEYLALGAFQAGLLTATDGSQVEALWAKFIQEFQQGPVSIGLAFSLEGRREAKLAFAATYAALGMSSQAASSFAAYTVATLLQGANLGAQSAMLCIGYQDRILWYLNDIDNG